MMKQFKNLKLSKLTGSTKVGSVIHFVSEEDIKNKANIGEISYKSVFSSKIIEEDFKKAKSLMLYPEEARLFLVQSSDKDGEIRANTSQAIGTVAKYASEASLTFSPSVSASTRSKVLNAAILSNYKFDLKTSFDEEYDNYALDKLYTEDLDKEQKHWQSLAEACVEARDLANIRPDVATPQFFEDRAQELAKSHKLKIEVIKGEELKKKGMNLIHAVGRTATVEPRIVILTYKGRKGTETDYALVGKGVTFDTGGVNLKPTGWLEDMYIDKHGACTVFAAFKKAVEDKVDRNITCVMALAENSLGGDSYRPSDILKSYKGITVEITNTDAEGRLCLADAMTYIQETQKPAVMVDVATLTGACMVALGNETAGLFGNDADLTKNIKESGEIVGEKYWELPVTQQHRNAIKARFSDIRNCEKGRLTGGASVAAAFLEKFVETGTKWAHLDIAGPAHSETSKPTIYPGCTGFGAQTLYKLVLSDVHKI